MIKTVDSIKYNGRKKYIYTDGKTNKKYIKSDIGYIILSAYKKSITKKTKGGDRIQKKQFFEKIRETAIPDIVASTTESYSMFIKINEIEEIDKQNLILYLLLIIIDKYKMSTSSIYEYFNQAKTGEIDGDVYDSDDDESE